MDADHPPNGVLFPCRNTFGGLGGGLSCPRLQFGGGGPAIGSIGIGAGGAGSGRYINGTITALPGYTLPPNQQGSF